MWRFLRYLKKLNKLKKLQAEIVGSVLIFSRSPWVICVVVAEDVAPDDSSPGACCTLSMPLDIAAPGP